VAAIIIIICLVTFVALRFVAQERES